MADLLPHYLTAWGLTDPQPLTETRTSQLYTVTYERSRAVLKLLKPAGEEERTGAAALRCFDGHGAVKLLQSDDNAHLLEYADGDDLVGMVKRGDDEGATALLADVLNQLHSAPPCVAMDGIIPLTLWFRPLYDQADQDRRKGITSIFTRAAPIAERVLAAPLDTCVLHGDIHHENVRYRNGRGYLAFDPKGLIGERAFDTANIFRNPMNMDALVEDETRILRMADILSHKMTIPPSRILTNVYLLCVLSASWILSDGDDPASDLRIAAIVEPHLPSMDA